MADEPLLDVLQQGVAFWNMWRLNEGDGVAINLSEANLHEVDLKDVNLHRANLRNADLTNAELTRADLSGADLTATKLAHANLSYANLSGADLSSASLQEANLSHANLSEINLRWADLTGTDLSGANLSGANLSAAKLSAANLNDAILREATLNDADLTGADLRWAELRRVNVVGANFSQIECYSTSFAGIDLSTVIGLETIYHHGPSYLDVITLYMSRGKIPEIFLRGCGIPETLMTYLPSLLNKAIDFYSCFISYSHANKEFARRLHDRLQGEGIRCWLDEHQLNIGDPLHPTIYEAIRVYDKVLLCCSETALTSWWVEKEFGRAIRKEEDYKANVLVPLNLDGYLFDQKCDGWVADELKQRLVADFTNWKDHDAFEGGVKAVMKALRTDGGNLPHPAPKLKPKR